MAGKAPPDEAHESEIGTGEESQAEMMISNYLGTGIHLFLSALAVLLLVAAAIAAFDTVVRDFPKLWGEQQDEYRVLLKIVDNLLLVAITAEFGLLLLFRRLSAAVEVVIFVLARKTVNPEVGALDLVLCAGAIAGLIVVRFYYLPGKTT
ncbi:MAG: hypothetical protein ACR2IH_03830 [Pyrinomonadaceae bacterium]